MTNHKQNHPPSQRTRLRSVVCLFALSLGLAATSRAADWYLKATQGRSSHWSSDLADWTTNRDGTGANPASIGSDDTFDTNNQQLRTPAVSTDTTFPGGVLRLTGRASVIGMKTSGTAVAVVPKLVSTAGTIDAWHTIPQSFRVDDWENLASGTSFTALKALPGHTLRVSIGKLTGSGETRMLGGGTVRLEVADAEHYLGTIRVSSGAANFENDIVTSGSLVIEPGATVILDQAVSFSSFIVAGYEYPPGNYSFSILQSLHPSVFTSGTTGGFVTVRASTKTSPPSGAHPTDQP
jgi:hypothetical protein